MAWRGCRDRDGVTHGPLCSVPVPRSSSRVRLGDLGHMCARARLCALVRWGPASTACVWTSDGVTSPGKGTGTYSWAHPSARQRSRPPKPSHPAGETEARRVCPPLAAASGVPAVPRREAPAAAGAGSHVFGGPTTEVLTQPHVCECRQGRQVNQKRARRGGRAREASGEPRIHPIPPASWHDGDSVGYGGVSHPGVAVPGWHRCPAAPCHSIPTPTPPPPSWAGKLAVVRRGHVGTAAGDDACPRCQGRVVPAGAGGTVAAGTGLGSRSLRVWGDSNGAGRGSVCRGMHVHACVHVCVRACAHTPPPHPPPLFWCPRVQPGLAAGTHLASRLFLPPAWI